jgi:urea transport system ATP-binding protein
MTETAPVLELKGLTAGYFGIPAVRDISLRVGAGEVVALLGPNGAGKTTTLSTTAGLLKPIDGEVLFDGEPVGARAPEKLARQGLTLIPEDRALFFDLTSRENLKLAKRGNSMDEGEIIEMLPELEKCLDRKAGVLSGGEQQQLAIGRALAGQPELLLLDEPTEGIQPNIVQQIEDALLRVRTELGVAILIVEQNLDFAWSFAERYFVMQRGRIVKEGRTATTAASEVASLIHV